MFTKTKTVRENHEYKSLTGRIHEAPKHYLNRDKSDTLSLIHI